ncbi:DUF1223 domain-containing protein [Methylobacterium sp. Leaf93]|uniref:DUF1223 domain-containing protein n=1 Tax=Methylobacterium sp. Leaf93 TaxID=1736249 RepID=UPI0007017070|nr:DUF1223 domain-containing protein [Methylobacterium sp. Leaf93]KQP13478.1 hypothetical protein ASF26_19095 [Methylobacterium sp. Leaf93]
MRRSAPSLLALTIVLTHMVGPARAEPPRAVIELFTSQGCGACQQASRMMGEYAQQPDVIALTMPVTYWDYLGWKDEFAIPAFTERQRAYALSHGERQLFTPQAIINGEPSPVRSDRAFLDRSLRAARQSSGLIVSVKATDQGNRIAIDIGAGRGTGELWLLPILRRHRTAVAHGENKGQVVDYVNVVRGMHRVGAWTGQATHFELPRTLVRSGNADGYVVVLQSGTLAHPARILGATKGPGF